MTESSKELKIGKLSIALYKNHLNAKDGKITYHAKVVNRDKASMADICNDIVAAGDNCGLTADEIKKIWLKINQARMKRLTEGISTEDDIGTIYLSVKGTFADDQTPFTKGAHTVTVHLRPSSKTAQTMAGLTPVITQGNTCHPVIESVEDMRTLTGTTLSPGGLLNIKGRNICITGDDDSVGLYFENVLDAEEAVKVSAKDLGTNSRNNLCLIIPDALKEGCCYRLKLVTQFNGNKKVFRKEPQTAYATATPKVAVTITE